MTINWDAFGAIAEALGALAVILSVLYLATQIRSQTREARLSATRDLSTEFRQVLESIALDHEYSEIYQAGIYDYEGLADNDRMRVSYMLRSFLLICEQQYLHTKHGSIDTIFMDSSERVFREFLKAPGVQQFWRLSKHSFNDDFRTYIDTLKAEAESQDFGSSFRHKHATDAPAPE
jgi:hypothetical protein